MTECSAPSHPRSDRTTFTPADRGDRSGSSPSPQFGLQVDLTYCGGNLHLDRLRAIAEVRGGVVRYAGVHESECLGQLRRLLINCASAEHMAEVADQFRRQEKANVVAIEDLTLLDHARGKLTVAPKRSLGSADDLARAYTPGVARVCEQIAADRAKAFDYTIKANTVAVISDGSAVLGLGDVGPEAAMPVMEGKAMLFKAFADIDAFPICLDTRDPAEIIQATRLIAPTFGGINLEDISAPRCFEIEEQLKAELEIPVFHDDQHGTAVVVMAALLNSLRLVDKPMESLRVLLVGLGAAGVACTKMMLAAGVRDIVGCDRKGAISTEREDYLSGEMTAIKRWYAENSNPEKLRGGPNEVIEGRDLFIGLSGPGLIAASSLKRMADDAIVFAMANPVPEVMPAQAEPYVRIMATGRSDFPNQINNVLCFPGLFRGALDAGASAITEEMKLAAARAIAEVVGEGELNERYIVPSVFDHRVAPAVAAAVKEATSTAQRRVMACG